MQAQTACVLSHLVHSDERVCHHGHPNAQVADDVGHSVKLNDLHRGEARAVVVDQRMPCVLICILACQIFSVPPQSR